MASTLTKIYIHLIFHIKTTSVKIRVNDLQRLFVYVGGIIKNHDGIPVAIGGIEDHMHILFALPKTSAVSEFARIVKANSSRWIKSIDKFYSNFEWQEGYGAFSVSPTLIDKTTDYVLNQAKHHAKRTFIDEYKLFLNAYGIKYDEHYAFSD